MLPERHPGDSGTSAKQSFPHHQKAWENRYDVTYRMGEARTIEAQKSTDFVSSSEN